MLSKIKYIKMNFYQEIYKDKVNCIFAMQSHRHVKQFCFFVCFFFFLCVFITVFSILVTTSIRGPRPSRKTHNTLVGHCTLKFASSVNKIFFSSMKPVNKWFCSLTERCARSVFSPECRFQHVILERSKMHSKKQTSAKNRDYFDENITFSGRYNWRKLNKDFQLETTANFRSKIINSAQYHCRRSCAEASSTLLFRSLTETPFLLSKSFAGMPFCLNLTTE